ncbi:MAG: hypothetical protein IJ072_05120 [Oscillospiraceae bacterium]|nr:hypothetical protein [Oscillospiraceae bacterium]
MIKIEALYTEVCNLYGDAFNVEFLRQSLPEAEIFYTSLSQTPRFVREDMDFIYMGAVPESEQEYIIQTLMPYTGRIRQLIAHGKVFLMTGNAFEVFGTYIETDSGEKIEALGIYDGFAVRRMMKRYNSLFYGSFTDERAQQREVVGFKSQFTHTYVDNTQGYVFSTIRGCGINPQSKLEGIRINNFFGTYLIGPLLVMNPYFTKYLLRLAGVEEPALAFEQVAIDAYNDRLRDFRDPKRLFES